MSLGTTIKTIQDIMRKDAGVDGDAQRISQLGWMIFLKVFDDSEDEREMMVDGYKSPIPARFRWRTWASNSEGITGEALLDFVNNDLFRTLKALPAGGKSARVAAVVRGVFEDAFNYMKSGTLMRQVINKLNEIDFNRASDRHQFGEIYEKILGDLQSAGNAGEYYTPRAVTQFAVDQVDPQLGETVLDPACGTGGFLTCAIEHVRGKYVKGPKDREKLQESILGIEKKQLPHLLCVTNMMFHGIDVPSNIRHDNALARPLRDYGPKDRVDVIVTNPPFGGIEEDGIEQNFPQTFRTRETADLFLALIMTLLKPEGRAAIVLPDGSLFGEGGVKTRIKEKLLEECNLHTVVRLPNGVFSPYTGIKTNILFFTKGTPTKTVWYYEHPYPEGYKSYSKTKPMRIDEFEAEKKWWGNRKENDRAWKVTIEEIKARNYNLDIKNPRAVDEGPGSADELLKEYRAATGEVAKVMGTLRAEIQPELKRLSEHLEKLIDRPEAVEELRRALLGLAVKGRLTTRADSRKGHRTQSGAGMSETRDVPYQLPPGWVWSTIGDVCTDSFYGPRFGKNEYVEQGGVPTIRTTDMTVRGEIVLKNAPQVRVSQDRLAYFRLEPGDLLVTRTGSIGMMAVFSGGYDAIPSAYLIRFRFAVGVEAKYVYLYLKSPGGQRFLGLGATRMAQPNINAATIRAIPLPLPPLAEQRQIVATAQYFMALCDDLETKLRARDEKAAKLAEALVAEVLA